MTHAIKRQAPGTKIAGRSAGGEFAAHQRADAVFNDSVNSRSDGLNPNAPSLNQMVNTPAEEWFNMTWRERKPIIAEAVQEVINITGSEATFKGWSRSERTLGRTFHRVNRYTGETLSVQIDLSDIGTRTRTPGTIAETITHEVAHSLANPRAGHGPEWKTLFEDVKRQLGLDQAEARVVAFTTEEEDRQQELAKEEKLRTSLWLGTCPQGHQFPAARKRTRTYSCVACQRAGKPATIVFEKNPNRA